jgi:hypothetical protein
LSNFIRAIQLRRDDPKAMFGKARTLCVLAGRTPQRFPPNDIYREAIELLERAVGIDKTTIRHISRDRHAFGELKKAPEFGPRFISLVWGNGS